MTQGTASGPGEVYVKPEPIVYLVDDDPSFLRAVSRRLRAADLRVEAFGSAEAFLNRRRSEAAGCAVLDLRMPGLGGLELQNAPAAKKELMPVVFLTASARSRPVIFITAEADDSVREQASRIPGSVYLRKPFAGAELIEAVRSGLSQSGSSNPTHN
jgi:FixJ family two-component response regulator